MKRNVLLIFAYLAVPIGGAAGFFAGALWLSTRTHEFSPWDLRYLLLVRETHVGRLGLIEPVGGTVRYAARGQDGTAPASILVQFKSKAMPEQVIVSYEGRCQAIGLTTRRGQAGGNLNILHCASGSAELDVTAARQGEGSEVTVSGWEF